MARTPCCVSERTSSRLERVGSALASPRASSGLRGESGSVRRSFWCRSTGLVGGWAGRRAAHFRLPERACESSAAAGWETECVPPGESRAPTRGLTALAEPRLLIQGAGRMLGWRVVARTSGYLSERTSRRRQRVWASKDVSPGASPALARGLTDLAGVVSPPRPLIGGRGEPPGLSRASWEQARRPLMASSVESGYVALGVLARATLVPTDPPGPDLGIHAACRSPGRNHGRSLHVVWGGARASDSSWLGVRLRPPGRVQDPDARSGRCGEVRAVDSGGWQDAGAGRRALDARHGRESSLARWPSTAWD